MNLETWKKLGEQNGGTKNVTIDCSSSTKVLYKELVRGLGSRDNNFFWWLIKKINFTLFILVVNQIHNLHKCCGILLTPLRWLKQIKRTVAFDVTTRFNPIQQSTAMYNSHILNVRNTTINVTKRSTNRSTMNNQLKHSKYTVVFLLSLRKAVFLH